MFKNKSLSLSILLAATPFTTHAQSDAFPTKPIRLIVPFAPGGSVDLISRLMSAKMSELLGQQLIVDNRAGASGNIGSELVARASADGYTLLMNTLPFVVNPAIFPRVPYHPINDFAPVGQVSTSPSVLTVHPSVPVNSVKDLLALAKARPGNLSYGSNGVGSAYHIAGALFATLAGIQLLHVPYRGGGATAITDLVSGRVDMMWNNPAFLLPNVRAGKLKALGVTGRQRIPGIKDVPTIAESGLPGYEISGWQGLLGPAHLPKGVVARLHGALLDAFSTSAMQTLWESRGMTFVQQSPEQFSLRLRQDFETYGKLIRQVGNKID